jgi:hypothetical protein
MYQRSKMQARALDNLARYTEYYYKGQRVTKGYVLSQVLGKYSIHTFDKGMLLEAIKLSDIKEEGPGTPVNFNITYEANEQLNQLKQSLDAITGRSFFPAQVIDILLIYATKKLGHKEIEKNEIEVGIEINTLRVEAIALLLHASENTLINVLNVLKGGDEK